MALGKDLVKDLVVETSLLFSESFLGFRQWKICLSCGLRGYRRWEWEYKTEVNIKITAQIRLSESKLTTSRIGFDYL